MAFTSRFRSGAAFGNAVFNGLANFKGAVVRNYVRVTANYTVLPTDSRIFVGANSETVTLPAASTVGGQTFSIINDNFTGTTVATAGGNIVGAATDTTSLATAYAHAEYVSDGQNFFIA